MQLSATTPGKKKDPPGLPGTIGRLLMIACWLFSQAPAMAQDAATTKITIQIRQQTLASVFKEIGEKTGLTIEYRHDIVDKDRLVNIQATDETVQKILNRLLSGTHTRYIQQGKSILIVKDDRLASPKDSAGKRNAAGIDGKIVDEDGGDPLAGATIHIGDKDVISDMDGAFHMNLPAGEYTAEISAVGFGTKKITGITINTGRTFELHGTLKRQKGQLAGVLVTASARNQGVSSLYTRQKNSAAMTNGISADQIARTPDKTVGETLKRISGVATIDNKYVVVRGLSERFNGAMLNGQLMPSTEMNRKQFSFDIIPSGLIESIVVYKTITPDMSAEFGGGLIDVTTQSIPRENFLSVSAGAGYNDNTTGKNFKGLPISNKEYFGGIPDDRMLMGKADWHSRKDIQAAFTPSSFSNNWALYDYTPRPSQNYQLTGGHVLTLPGNRRLGFIASISYRNTWQTQDIRMTRNGFEGIGADTTDKETGFSGKRYGFTVNIGGLAAIGYSTPRSKLSWQTLNLRTLDQQFLLGTGHEEPLGQAVAYNDQFSRTNLWQHQLKGEYLLTQKGMKLEWMGSYSVLDRQKPDNHVFVANYAGDGKNDPSQPVDFSISSAQSYLVDGALRSWSRAGEKNFNWKADLMVPFTFTAGNIVLTNSLKGGYAGWHKDRRFWVVNTSSGYNTGDYQPLTEYFEPSLHPQGMHISLDQFGDDMHKAASLHAGYLMLDNKIGKKWRLAWGVRAEYFNINAANALEDSLFANLNAGNPGGKVFDFSAIKKREPSWNFFPSANLVYTLGKAMNLRLAYSKSIIRPDLRELSYFREYDYELGGEYVSQTPVRSTTLHHYDFRYEWYPAAGEVISLSAFYKKMQYPMEIYKLGANRVYELRNNKSAENKGLEIEMRRSLAFTGIPVVKDLTVYGNFTWLRSKVIPMSLSYTLNQDTGKIIVVVPHEGYGKEEKRPQTGASNYMINAGLYYDTKYISATLSYNYVTNRMYRPETNYWESLFERPMQGLDAQLAVRLLNRKMQVTANLSNLLNSRSLVYTNFYANPEISNGRQAPSTRDLLYQKGTDRLEYESRPGRTYSINITYRF